MTIGMMSLEPMGPYVFMMLIKDCSDNDYPSAIPRLSVNENSSRRTIVKMKWSMGCCDDRDWSTTDRQRLAFVQNIWLMGCCDALLLNEERRCSRYSVHSAYPPLKWNDKKLRYLEEVYESVSSMVYRTSSNHQLVAEILLAKSDPFVLRICPLADGDTFVLRTSSLADGDPSVRKISPSADGGSFVPRTTMYAHMIIVQSLLPSVAWRGAVQLWVKYSLRTIGLAHDRLSTLCGDFFIHDHLSTFCDEAMRKKEVQACRNEWLSRACH